MLLPVMDALRTRGDVDISVLALTMARGKVAKAGYDPIGFRDLVEPGDEAALAIGRRLAESLPPSSDVPHDESVAYLGLSYRELELGLGERGAQDRFAAEGRRAFLPVETTGRLIDRLDPDIVVATNSPRAERAMIEAAGRRSIPSLALGDLFLNSEWPWMARNGYATRVGVMAEWVKRHLIEKGRAPEDIVVTGNPAFDRIVSPDARDAGKCLRQALGWQDNLVIALALPLVRAEDPRLSAYGDYVGELEHFCRQAPDARVIIRPHPNQPLQDFEMPPDFRFSGRDEDFYAVLWASDIVVTAFSTVGLEAALAGRQVVTIGADGTVPYGELGLSTEIADVRELGQALDRVRRERPRPDLSRLGAPPPGTATGNVVRLIDDLLAGEA